MRIYQPFHARGSSFPLSLSLSLRSSTSDPVPYNSDNQQQPRSTMSYTPMASTSSSSANHPTFNSNSNLSRPKRRLSNATVAFDHSDQEDEDNLSKPRSKRNRVARANSEALEIGSDQAADSQTGGGAGSGARGANGKVLSEKEKDARRQARMIRNRSEFLLPSPHLPFVEGKLFHSSPFDRSLIANDLFFTKHRCCPSFSRPQKGAHSLSGAKSS